MKGIVVQVEEEIPISEKEIIIVIGVIVVVEKRWQKIRRGYGSSKRRGSWRRG